MVMSVVVMVTSMVSMPAMVTTMMTVAVACVGGGNHGESSN